ncbi:MAG: hypothetical protein KGJ79_11610 [Alphaproteobacteria bacterium]|nr:hypothetical protein [Alphaproteobacteria bacterium]MDE2495446.1 hypothetical protein [Alphaproteobacteria bacterium]
MGVIAILFGLGLFLVLLWNFAVYALPAYIGFSAGWWALNHGAGIGCIAVGAIAGVAVFLAGRVALASRNGFLRWLVIAVFVIPAAWAGYAMVLDLSASGMVPSSVWRHILAAAGAVAVGATTMAQLVQVPEWEKSS